MVIRDVINTQFLQSDWSIPAVAVGCCTDVFPSQSGNDCKKGRALCGRLIWLHTHSSVCPLAV